jgi:hypothetical protein
METGKLGQQVSVIMDPFRRDSGDESSACPFEAGASGSGYANPAWGQRQLCHNARCRWFTVGTHGDDKHHTYEAQHVAQHLWQMLSQ